MSHQATKAILLADTIRKWSGVRLEIDISGSPQRGRVYLEGSHGEIIEWLSPRLPGGQLANWLYAFEQGLLAYCPRRSRATGYKDSTC